MLTHNETTKEHFLSVARARSHPHARKRFSIRMGRDQLVSLYTLLISLTFQPSVPWSAPVGDAASAFQSREELRRTVSELSQPPLAPERLIDCARSHGMN